MGITINAQHQLEFGSIANDHVDQDQDDENQIIEQYTQYQLQKPQSDV